MGILIDSKAWLLIVLNVIEVVKVEKMVDSVEMVGARRWL